MLPHRYRDLGVRQWRALAVQAPTLELEACAATRETRRNVTGAVGEFPGAGTRRFDRVGYPERFAQEALGHNSKAVHRAYARRAQVKLPSLESYERQAADGRIIQIAAVFPGDAHRHGGQKVG